MRTVRAGEMFLSQSGKGLQFGLSSDSQVESTTVYWPGGERETFGAIAKGKHYLLKQGSGTALALASPSKRRDLNVSHLPTRTSSPGNAAIALPSAIPLPPLSYLERGAIRRELDTSNRSTLLVFWSATCPHCRAELSSLGRRHDELASANLRILPLCVDQISERAIAEASNLIAATGYPGTWGFIQQEDFEQLMAVQSALFDKTPPAAVPLSFLLNPHQSLVSLYRGPIPQDVLLFDLSTLTNTADRALRNLALPFAGRWFTQPAAADFAPKMIARRVQANYPELSLPYLHIAATLSNDVDRENLLKELAAKHHQLARQYSQQGKVADASYHFQKSLQSDQNNPLAHNDYGTLLAQTGKLEEGAAHFEEALRLRPDYPLAKRNLDRARMLIDQQNR